MKYAWKVSMDSRHGSPSRAELVYTESPDSEPVFSEGKFKGDTTLWDNAVRVPELDKE